MSKAVALGVFLGLVSIVGVVVYLGIDTPEEALAEYDKFRKEIPTGDSITFLKLKSPEQHPDMDAGYTIDDVVASQYYENGTEKPKNSTISGTVSDSTYGANFNLVSKFEQIENKMIVHQGNVAYIEAVIEIINPDTGEPLSPSYYNYHLEIVCSSLVEFCNMNEISEYKKTDSGGYLNYKWHTSQRDMKSLYEVIISAESEVTDPDTNRPYKVENKFYIELI